MSEEKKCLHRKLTFWSGGYYVACAESASGFGCGQRWVAVRNGNEGERGLDPGSGQVQGPGDVRIEPHLLERIALAAQEPEEKG